MSVMNMMNKQNRKIGIPVRVISSLFVVLFLLMMPSSAERSAPSDVLLNPSDVGSTGQSVPDNMVYGLNASDYVQDQIIVRYKTGSTDTVRSLSDAHVTIGSSVLRDEQALGVPGMQVVSVQIPVPDAISYYRQLPYVAYAEPNYIFSIDESSAQQTAGIPKIIIPNDPDFLQLWGLFNTGKDGGTYGADINATNAWLTGTNAPDTIIAVVDTGVDYTHPDLAGNCIQGYNSLTGSMDPMDDNGHGTHCAGIIAAIGNNSIGVTGVVWKTQVMPVKVLNGSGSGTTDQVIRGIHYAQTHGAEIISCSWGNYQYSQALKDAIEQDPAILFVCAAGNEAVNTDVIPSYPSSYGSSNIISVGASDSRDMMASFSNDGSSSVHVIAPGVHILSTIPNTGYDYLSGTSMATPYVSGIAGLLKGQNSHLIAPDLKEIIMGTVDVKPQFIGQCSTGGRVDAAKAIERVHNTSDISAEPTSGQIPLTVQFKAITPDGCDHWYWTFGDGGTATEQNPRYTYTKAGTYTVSLTASAGNVSFFKEKKSFVHATTPVIEVNPFPDGNGGYYPRPTDPDGSGQYKDINGNGFVDFHDPQVFLDNFEFAMNNEPVDLFDFDKNGFIGFGDINTLYNSV